MARAQRRASKEPLSLDRLRKAYADARRARVLRAREDVNTFIQFVFKDEKTNASIKQAPIHLAWHELLTQSRRAVIWSHTEAGKTWQIAIGRVLWEIGRDPTIRVAIVSNTHEQALKIIRAIASYIEKSEELQEVFPKLRPAQPWTDHAITVERPVLSKDPTVQAKGVHGNILGSRLDLVVIDDLLDWENTRTPEERDKLWAWLQSSIHSRLTLGGRLWVIGTAFHPDDALHRYARTAGYAAVKYPVVQNPDDPPEKWVPRWPERWPLERILAERAGDRGLIEFARQLLCQPYNDSASVFKRTSIELGLQRGAGRSLASSLNRVPPGCVTITGVDLGVQRHAAADLTVLFTILGHKNGDRELLDVEAGRWPAPEIIDRIISAHQRFASLVMVENNAAQDYIVQMVKHRSAVPVRGFTTGKQKADPAFGVASIATEMANGKWIIPNDTGSLDGDLDPEVRAWISEMLSYDPRAHTGDRLMASWLAREGVRLAGIKAETGRIDLLSR